MAQLTSDLEAETRAFLELTAGLPAQAWQLPTPALGWDIADQVSHLAYYDEAALRAAVSPRDFDPADGSDPDGIAARYQDLSPPALLDWFTSARRTLLNAFGPLDPRARLPWYGPSMSAATLVTARLMETWAHGQDIADALGSTRQPTARLRHIAHLGIAARNFSLTRHGLPADRTPVRVELTAPGQEVWTRGPDDASNRVTGPALDFCLTVTEGVITTTPAS